MKKDDPSENDPELFKDLIKVDKKLKYDGIAPVTRRLPIIPKQRLKDEAQVIEDMFSEEHDPSELETGDELLYFQPGVTHAQFKKMRQGKLSIEGELDLHGLSVTLARESLAHYLHHCQLTRKRCVRIIHGKGRGSKQGRPVIKNKVNTWLRQREEVLAFCSARQMDGGTGAIYVLLKLK